MRRVCIFCGSSPGIRPAYAESARQMGQALVKRGVGLVYGGGRVGLMGMLADAVLDAGGEAIGVIPESLMARELGHGGLTELRVVKSMHARKALMADLADAFVALPGGFGTFEEFCEVLTWSQLGLHRKPFGLLNIEGYYDPLLAMFDHAMAEGFVRPAHRRLVLEGQHPDRLLDHLARYQAPQLEQWIGPEEI